MLSNSVETGTSIIEVDLTETMEAELEQHALSLNISKNHYCKLILEQWLVQKKI